MKTTRRHSGAPLPVACFRVLIDGEEIGIMSMSPLLGLVEGEVEPEQRQSVTLRRAATKDRRLFEWYRCALKGKDHERELAVVQLDAPGGKPVNVWRLQQARPVRWTGPAFDALGNDIAMEELEVRYAAIAWRRSL